MSSEKLRSTPATEKASVLARIAIATTVLSIAGMAALFIGSAMGANGFTDDTSSAAANIAWLCFSVGALVALATGIAALVRGRLRRSRPDLRAGMIAVAYFVIAAAIVVVTS
jgi:formate-dependent nitrite reductase membrane component NrfD